MTASTVLKPLMRSSSFDLDQKNDFPQWTLLIVPEALNSEFQTFKLNSTLYWVAVKELKLSYYIGETLLFAIYTLYGNLI